MIAKEHQIAIVRAMDASMRCRDMLVIVIDRLAGESDLLLGLGRESALKWLADAKAQAEEALANIEDIIESVENRHQN
jgi:hypothetical protein